MNEGQMKNDRTNAQKLCKQERIQKGGNGVSKAKLMKNRGYCIKNRITLFYKHSDFSL